jgi:hypothetical protein
VKKLDHKKQRIVKEAASADRFVQSMKEMHPWILTEKQFFGHPGTDYDFSARDPKAAGAQLKALEAEQAALSKRVNKKVCACPHVGSACACSCAFVVHVRVCPYAAPRDPWCECLPVPPCRRWV